MAGLADQLTQARTVIAALTAATAGPGGLTSFSQTDGLLEVADDGKALDRRFSVTAPVESIGLTDEFGPDAAQFRGRFRVQVRYDQAARHEAAANRIVEDVEQIVIALVRTTNYAAGVQIVNHVGSSIVDEGEFPVLQLDFECLYRRSY